MNEYRIKYNAGETSLGIVIAITIIWRTAAVQALQFHELTRLAKRLNFQTISVEKYCRYSDRNGY